MMRTTNTGTHTATHTASETRSGSTPSGADVSAKIDETVSIHVIEASLETHFGSSLTPEQRCGIAKEALDRYRKAPVQGFTAILAQRHAVDIATARLGAAESRCGVGQYVNGQQVEL